MKVIILCGGKGTRLREETEYKPKPMVEIGNIPILMHIINIYSYYGYKDFILAIGHKGNVIRNYFLNHEYYNNDFTITLGKQRKINVHSNGNTPDCNITIAETGEETMTGGRIKCCEKYINEDHFMVTYGDGLADINIRKLVEFHLSHGKMGTLTGVNPPGRYGELFVEGNYITEFKEKKRHKGVQGTINGGFMVFKKEFFQSLSDDPDLILEDDPLERLSLERELMVFAHDGYWQCMDTYRDYRALKDTWKKGKAPWIFE